MSSAKNSTNDCAYKILIQCENIPAGGRIYFQELVVSLEDYSEDEVFNALLYLQESGYITCVYKKRKNVCDKISQVRGLTPKGQKHLDDLRSNNLTGKIKKIFSGVALACIKEFFYSIIKFLS